ncbi:unnamed protein product [Adineta ricciae]|uniref:Uncharacterized protein n=1 Tax=Adineta ricciae TaxID=249248 RepID=A0A815FZD2_ADIRI|nr:unnamed protein product [Adineta ricciae]
MGQNIVIPASPRPIELAQPETVEKGESKAIVTDTSIPVSTEIHNRQTISSTDDANVIQESTGAQSSHANLRHSEPISMPKETWSKEDFTMTVIWCDINVHDPVENVPTQNEIVKICKFLYLFKDYEACEEHIRYLDRTDEVILVVSGSMGSILIPLVHDSRQVKFINVKESLTRQIYNEQIGHLTEKEGVSFNVYRRRDKKHLESCASFIWMHLFTKILINNVTLFGSSSSSPLTTSHTEEKDKLVAHLRRMYDGKEEVLAFIDDFHTNYSANEAIQWYTRESILYEQLNKALRYKNLKLLLLFRFFIYDMWNQLSKNSKEQKESLQSSNHHHQGERRIEYAYRGQWMSATQIESLTESPNEFTSVNSFMSTSEREDVAREFAEKQHGRHESLRSVLFKIQMKVYPASETQLYASIKNESQFSSESEVLFAPGTIFRIHKIIHPMNKEKPTIIQLTLCKKNAPELHELITYWEENIESETNQASLGWLIMQTGQTEEAINFYRTLLDGLKPDDPLKKECYYGVGNLFVKLEEYQNALHYYKKALTKSQDDQKWIAKIESALAYTYVLLGDSDEALTTYKDALLIYIAEYDEVHKNTVQCYTGIGDVHQSKKEYASAIDSYTRALELGEQLNPPPKDPLYLNILLINLASIYYIEKNYKESLSLFEKALNNYNEKLRNEYEHLLYHDEKLGMLHENIGHVYRKDKKYSEALLSFHKAAEIYYYTFPQTNQHNQGIRKAIRYCNKKLRNKQATIERYQNEHSLSEQRPSSISSRHHLISREKSKDTKQAIVEEPNQDATVNGIYSNRETSEKPPNLSEDHTRTSSIRNQATKRVKQTKPADDENEPNLNQPPRIDSRRK